jgi:hypothetical protein
VTRETRNSTVSRGATSYDAKGDDVASNSKLYVVASCAPGERQRGKSGVLAGTVGEGARQIDAGVDEYTNIEQVA